jgi:NitT/TauT family transport system substrate-binding protein
MRLWRPAVDPAGELPLRMVRDPQGLGAADGFRRGVSVDRHRQDPTRRGALRRGQTLLLSPLVLSSCIPVQPPAKLRIAVDTQNPLLQLSLFAAARQRFFANERLEVTLVEMADGGSATEALVKGGAEVASAGFDHVLRSTANGRKLMAFGVLSRSPLLVLVANPGARKAPKSTSDLEGRRVAVPAIGGESDLFARFVAHEAGVDPDSLDMVASGNALEAAKALQSFLADAAVVDSAAARWLAAQPGAVTVLEDTRTLTGLLSTYGVSTYPGSCLYARPEWLDAKAEEARRLLRAVREGVRWCQQQPPEAVAGLLPESYRKAWDPPVLSAAVAETVPLLSSSGAFTADGAEAVRRVLAISSPSFRTARFTANSYTNAFVPR